MRALIGIGANLSRPQAQVQRAVSLIACDRVRVMGCSRLVRSPAIGGPPDQPDYVNAAALVETDWPAESLAKHLHFVEQQLGRRRRVHWGPRIIDLDLLLVGDEVIVRSDLIVPHPRMALRPFVVGPAAEIAGEWTHPVLAATVGQIWQHLTTTERLVCVDAPPPAAQELQHRLQPITARGWQVVDRRDLEAEPSRTPRVAIRMAQVPVERDIAVYRTPAGRPVPTIGVERSDLNESRISDMVALILGTDARLNWLSE